MKEKTYSTYEFNRYAKERIALIFAYKSVYTDKNRRSVSSSIVELPASMRSYSKSIPVSKMVDLIDAKSVDFCLICSSGIVGLVEIVFNAT